MLALAIHYFGVDVKVRRGVKQENALPSNQTVLESSQDCQMASMTS